MLSHARQSNTFCQTAINSENRTHQQAAIKQATTPLALLYPPAFESNEFAALLHENYKNKFKTRDFKKNFSQYSGLIVFAKKTGLIDDVDFLGTTSSSDNIPYEQLHDAYTLSGQRIASWLNEEELKISGLAGKSSLFTLDTAIDNEQTPALWVIANPTPCHIELNGDPLIEKMINSILFLLRPHACMLMPQDLLDICQWAADEGGFLQALKKELESDDIEFLATELFNKPEFAKKMLGQFEVELDNVFDIKQHLEHVDSQFEPVPEHLEHNNSLTPLRELEKNSHYGSREKDYHSTNRLSTQLNKGWLF